MNFNKQFLLYHGGTVPGEGSAAVQRTEGRGTGKYIALAGVSFIVATLCHARKGKSVTANPPEVERPPATRLPENAFEAIAGWKLLFSDSPSAMCVCDTSTGEIVAANDSMVRRTHFCRAELLERKIEAVLCGGLGAITGESRVNIQNKDGSLGPARASATEFELGGQSFKLVVFQEVDDARSQVTAFSALGHRLSSARTQREAIQILLDTADQFFGWDACTFDHYDSEGDLIQPVVVIDRVEGQRREVEPVVKNAKPTAKMRKVIEEGPQLTLRQPPIAMAADSVPMGDQSRPSASILFVPVRSGMKVVGLLSIHSYGIGAYSEEDLKLLQALADHGAGALERIQAEERVQALNVELEQRVQERTEAMQNAVRELQAFSYSISHDMRAPLRAMEGYTQKVIEEYSGKVLDALGTEFLSRISRAAVRLDTLIQDVLTYTNVSRCDAPLTPVNLEGLLADMRATYTDWRAPNVKIEIAGSLPRVLGNEALLTQCFSQLIGNALKFVRQGAHPHVRIFAEPDGTHARVCVEDNGTGIDEEDRARIFRMFEQINPMSTSGGTGVGLTIVKKAVERMNGTLGCESVPGKGSKFWFQLLAANPV